MFSFQRVNTAMVSLHNNRTRGLYVYMPRVYSISLPFPRVSYLHCVHPILQKMYFSRHFNGSDGYLFTSSHQFISFLNLSMSKLLSYFVQFKFYIYLMVSIFLCLDFQHVFDLCFSCSILSNVMYSVLSDLLKATVGFLQSLFFSL